MATLAKEDWAFILSGGFKPADKPVIIDTKVIETICPIHVAIAWANLRNEGRV